MRPFLIAFVLAVGLAGCKKCDKPASPPVGTPAIKPDSGITPSFQIKNVIDRYQHHHPFGGGNGGLFWFLDIEKLPDSSVPLFLEVVHANRLFNAGTTEYSNGTWTISVYDSGVANGIYDFQLLARTGSQPVVAYPFKVIVSGNLSCTGYFTDLYFDALGYMPTATSFPNIRFGKSTPESDTILIPDFKNNAALKVVPDCYNGSLIIPFQKIGDTTYSGSGRITYDQNSMTTRVDMRILEESGNWAYIINYFMKSK